MIDLQQLFAPLIESPHLSYVVSALWQSYLISSSMFRQCFTKLQWSFSSYNKTEPLPLRFSFPALR